MLTLCTTILLKFTMILYHLCFLTRGRACTTQTRTRGAIQLSLPTQQNDFCSRDNLLLAKLRAQCLTLYFPNRGGCAHLCTFASDTKRTLLCQGHGHSTPFLLRISHSLSKHNVHYFTATQHYTRIPLYRRLVNCLSTRNHNVTKLRGTLSDRLTKAGRRSALIYTIATRKQLQTKRAPRLAQRSDDTINIRLAVSHPIRHTTRTITTSAVADNYVLILSATATTIHTDIDMPNCSPSSLTTDLSTPSDPFLGHTLRDCTINSIFGPILTTTTLRRNVLPRYRYANTVIISKRVFHYTNNIPRKAISVATTLRGDYGNCFVQLKRRLKTRALLRVSQRLNFKRRIPITNTLRTSTKGLPSTKRLTRDNRLTGFDFKRNNLLTSPMRVTTVVGAVTSNKICHAPFFIYNSISRASNAPLRALTRPRSEQIVDTRGMTLLHGVLRRIIRRNATRSTT